MSKDGLFAGPPICVVGNVNRDVTAQNVPVSPSLFERRGNVGAGDC